MWLLTLISKYFCTLFGGGWEDRLALSYFLKKQFWTISGRSRWPIRPVWDSVQMRFQKKQKLPKNEIPKFENEKSKPFQEIFIRKSNSTLSVIVESLWNVCPMRFAKGNIFKSAVKRVGLKQNLLRKIE